VNTKAAAARATEPEHSRFYDIAWLFRCDTCKRDVHLFARRHDGRIACAECWRAAGSPFPREAVTAAQIFAIEQATRERMKARGGTARHLVQSGKA
jgi:uncharacterized Zn finger protein (UPF0148 family)